MIPSGTFASALSHLWPHGDSRIPGLRAAMIAQAPALFEEFGLTTSVAIANMMGEFTEECGGGIEVEEDLNYRAAQLHSQWPSHFSIELALELQHNPRAIANQAYNGRMGNRVGTDDGWNYRGRDPAQSTGRDAYGVLARSSRSISSTIPSSSTIPGISFGSAASTSSPSASVSAGRSATTRSTKPAISTAA